VRGASVVDAIDVEAEVSAILLLCELSSAKQSWDSVAKIATNIHIYRYKKNCSSYKEQQCPQIPQHLLTALFKTLINNFIFY
jgi:hypothetical protein